MERYGTHITIALLLGLVGWAIWAGVGEDPTADALVGDAAAEFELPVLGSTERRGPQDYRGEVVLIDFWATYCGPCIDAMPALESVHSDYADRDFALLSVNVDPPRNHFDRDAHVRQFQQAHDLSFPVLLDYGVASQAYNVTSIPHLILLDRQGRVRYVHRRPPSEDMLRDEIDTLLSERS